MVFDIGLAGESDGYVVYHHPILPPLPIKPFKLNLPGEHFDKIFYLFFCNFMIELEKISSINVTFHQFVCS